MNILYIIDSLGAGGAERSTADTAKFLRNRGHQTTIICLKRKKIGIEEEIVSTGINIVFLKATNFISRVNEISKHIKREKPDVIHSVLFDSNLLLRVIKLFSPRLKILQSLVSMPYAKEREMDNKLPKFKFKVVKLIDWFTARLVHSYYHAITAAVLDHYKPLFNIKDSNSFVIYRGRENNFFLEQKKSIRQQLGFDDSFVFIAVGRQEFQKGHILILKALKELVADGANIDSFKVVFLGRDGKMSDDIQKFVLANNLSRYVQFMGFRNDVERVLVAADVFIFPSYIEGLGGALIEALAAGLPVICSSIPVFGEVIGNKEGAMFTETGNHEDLAKAMIKIYKDPVLRSRLAERSLERYGEAFQKEDVYNKMLSMYSYIKENSWK